MKLRIICTETDANQAAHVGGPIETSRRTFDVDAPADLVAWLTEPERERWSGLVNRWIDGVEVREA